MNAIRLHQSCGVLPPLVALLAATLLCQTASAGPVPQLSSLKSVYEKSLEDIKAEGHAAMKAWPAEYLEALQALEQSLQRAGDLDGLLVVRKETARFKLDTLVSREHFVAQPAQLRALQERYERSVPNLQQAQSRKVLNLVAKYRERLELLKKQLTQAGKIEEALAVNAEIERIGRAPEVTQAKFVIAERASQKPAPTPPEEKSRVSFPATSSGVRVHEPGANPGTTGHAHYGAVTLHSTGQTQASGNVSLSYLAGSATEMVGRLRVVRYYVRLSAKTTQPDLALKKPYMMVQYYAKKMRGRNPVGMPRELHVAYVQLPDLTTTPTYVDLPPVPPMTAGSSTFPPQWLGYAICGVLVSVFEGDGTLACQGTTNPALRPFAKATPPK